MRKCVVWVRLRVATLKNVLLLPIKYYSHYYFNNNGMCKLFICNICIQIYKGNAIFAWFSHILIVFVMSFFIKPVLSTFEQQVAVLYQPFSCKAAFWLQRLGRAGYGL